MKIDNSVLIILDRRKERKKDTEREKQKDKVYIILLLVENIRQKMIYNAM